MRVATWNLWWRFGPWEERQPAIRAALADIDADVVLLQEVFGPTADHHDQAEDLADHLGMHWVATTNHTSQTSFGSHTGRTSFGSDTSRTSFGSDTSRTSFGSDTSRTSFGSDTSRTSFGNAILSRWPVLDADQRNLPDRSGRPAHRTGLWALLDHPDGPQPVATTHLEWRYDDSRLRQAQLDDLVHWLDQHHRGLGALLDAPPDEHRPLIFGGDLNATPDSDEVRRLVGLAPGYSDHGDAVRVFTDAWAACGDGDGFTWTRDNPHSSDAQWPRRRLDYLFTSWPRPKPTGNPVACWVAGSEPVDGVVASDHACVVAEFDDRPPFDEHRTS
ncbi:MAG: endonuclease/exonuclease/phosphatase family protein [Acidimicrobiales bacterium]